MWPFRYEPRRHNKRRVTT
ncbi:hypothetical protein Goari_010540 [Gossypium aridum]|uniref:Uncharacterized protein n=1 Tax=Gossypium aridum TaxID=34290 RepID=A0A7J8Y1W8_GOSAI|nr:hypothetical protein [Gossypium aridum]